MLGLSRSSTGLRRCARPTRQPGFPDSAAEFERYYRAIVIIQKASGAVKELPDHVRVAVVPGVLLNHVQVHRPHRDLPAPPCTAVVECPGRGKLAAVVALVLVGAHVLFPARVIEGTSGLPSTAGHARCALGRVRGLGFGAEECLDEGRQVSGLGDQVEVAAVVDGQLASRDQAVQDPRV
jgi:hypothetical protein